VFAVVQLRCCQNLSIWHSHENLQEFHTHQKYFRGTWVSPTCDAIQCILEILSHKDSTRITETGINILSICTKHTLWKKVKMFWFLCKLYVLNCLVHPSIEMRTHIEAVLGYTPYISALLCFVWFLPVIYFHTEGKTPLPDRMKSFHVLLETEGTRELPLNSKYWLMRATKSLVCNADYPKHPYARLFLEWVELGWISFAVIEDKLSGEIVDKIVNTFVETKYAF